jgi:hypothetical protein
MPWISPDSSQNEYCSASRVIRASNNASSPFLTQPTALAEKPSSDFLLANAHKWYFSKKDVSTTAKPLSQPLPMQRSNLVVFISLNLHSP